MCSISDIYLKKTPEEEQQQEIDWEVYFFLDNSEEQEDDVLEWEVTGF